MAKRRRHYRKPSPVVCVGVRATRERRRQLGGVMTEVVPSESAGHTPVMRQRARVENVLDIMFRYRVNPLSDRQYKAGLKFYEIYNRSRYGVQFKVLCNPFLIGDHGDAEWKVLAHVHCERYLVEAYKALTPEEQHLVRKVCGHDDFPENKREHKFIRIALDKLATHWKYPLDEDDEEAI